MSADTTDTTQQNNINSPPIVAQRNIIPAITVSAVIRETFVPQVTNATRRALRNDRIRSRRGTRENSSPPETASAVIEEAHVPQGTAATRRSSRATKKPKSYAPAENPVRNTQVKWNETRWRRNHRRKGRVYKGPKVVDGPKARRKIPEAKKKASRSNAQVTNFGTCYVFASSRSSDNTRSDESSVNTADVNRQFEKARKLQEQHIISKQRKLKEF